MNESTREVSGTPTAAAAQATYTWRASDSDANTADSDTVALTFSLTVNKATLAAPTGLALKANSKMSTGFTITWTAVSNAAGYAASAMRADGTGTAVAVTVSGTTTEAVFTGLTAGTAYKVTVTATGDANYANSPASAEFDASTAADTAPAFADSATITDKTFTVDGEITAFTLPEASGGNGTISYALTPDLPTGLSLNESTREVSGTPTAAAAQATYTWRASDSDANTADSDTVALTFSLTVNKATLAAPTGLALKANSKTSTGFTITWTAVSNAAGYAASAMRADGTGTAVAVTVSGTTTEAVFTGLTAGTAYKVTVTATGDANYANSPASAEFDVSTLANSVPTVANAIPDQTATVDMAFEYIFPTNTFNDADGDSLTYTAMQTDGMTDSALPTWLSFTAAERKFTIAADAGEVGTVMVKVTASDGNGGTISDTFNIVVSAADTAPAFADSATITDKTFTVDGEITAFTLPEASGGNGTISYALTPDLPTGLSLNESTREVSGTPTAAAAQATYTWRASDSDANTADSDTAALTFSLTVNKATLAAPTGLALKANSKTSTGFTITWTAVSNAAGYAASAMRADGTGTAVDVTVSGTTTEAVFTGLTAGTAYKVTVTATGDANYANSPASAEFDASTAADTAPAFADSATITDKTFTVDGEITAFTLPEASGGNGTISYALTPDLPTGLSLNESTREVSGTPTAAAAQATYTWRASDSDANTADSDTVALTFSLTVNKATLAAPTGLALKANSKTSTGFTITWTAVSNAAGYAASAMRADGTGTAVDVTVSGTTTEAVFTGLTAGTAYKVTVTATGDANYANSPASAEFDVSTLANSVPTVANAIPDQAATVDTTFEYIFPTNTFNDTDGDSLTYTAMQTDGMTDSALPTWLSFTAAERKFTIAADAGEVGTVMVKVTASDGNGGTISDTFNIVVSAADTAPAFADSATITDKTFTVDGEITAFTLPEASGGNGTISYALTPDLPTGLSLNESTREVSGTPTAAAAQATYTWRASDSDANTANSDTVALTFSLTVNKATLAAPTGLALKANSKTSTGFTITWTAVSNAAGYAASAMRADGTGTAVDVTVSSGTTTEAVFTGLTAGTAYKVTVTATGDANYANSPASAEFDVSTLANSVPTVANAIPDQAATVDTAFEYIFPTNTFNDADGDSLTYTAMQTDGMTDSALPTWLSFTAAERKFTIAADAGEVGTVMVKVTASDGNGGTISDTFNIVVSAADTAPAFADSETITDKTFTVDGEITAFTLPEASGGNGTISYALTPDLPTGLSLNESTREVSGTPTAAAAQATYTWRASDSDANTADSDTAALTFSLTVNKATLAAPTGLALKANSKTSTGFTITWTAVSNAAGYAASAMRADGTGTAVAVTVSGTTTEAVFTGLTTGIAYKVTVTATGDANYANSPASAEFDVSTLADTAPAFADSATITDKTFTVDGEITAFTLPEASGGNGTISYALTPDLPTGLSLNESTREVSGTPTAAAAQATYTWRASDSDANTANTDSNALTFTLTVNKATLAAPTGLALKANSKTSTGFTITWTAVSNAAGYAASAMRADGTGTAVAVTVSGTTTEAVFTGLTAGTAYKVTVTATGDANYANSPASAEFDASTATDTAPAFADSATITDKTFTVDGEITAFTLPEASGGNGTISYALTPDLPTGLSLNESTREVSGTPTAAAAQATYTWRASDSDANTANTDSNALTFTLTVNKATLAAPTGLALKANSKTSTGFTITWTAVSNAAGYAASAMRADGTGTAVAVTVSGTTTEAVFTGLTAGTAYKVTVTATGDANYANSPASAEFDVSTAADTAPAFADSATITDKTFTVDGEITTFTLPEASGGNGTISYALTPDLPTGLSLNESTREVSGTPTAAAAQASYTWRASDSDANTADSDTAALTFSLTVNKATLAMPTGLMATKLVNGFTVNWTAVPGATEYEAYVVRTDLTTTARISATKVSGTSADWVSLNPAATYRVSVIAKAGGLANSAAGTLENVMPGVPPAGEAIKALYFSSIPGDLTGTYQLGEQIQITIKFKSPVALDSMVGKRPSIGLQVGDKLKQVSLIDVGDATTLVASYFVKAGDRDADGVSIAANAISLNGGKITSASDSTMNMTLTHAALPTDPRRKVDSSINTNPNAPSAPTLTGSTYGSLDVPFDVVVTATDADGGGLLYYAGRPVANAEVLDLAPTSSNKSELVSGTSVVTVTPRRAGRSATFRVFVEDDGVPRKFSSAAFEVFVAGLSYPAAAALQVGTAITDLMPTHTNFETGSTITYAVTGGTLPAGLNLASGTGIISGTPTAEATAPVTVTATGTKTDGGSTRTQTAKTIVVFPGTPRTAVTNLSLTASARGEVTATWTAASYAPSGYKLRWRKTGTVGYASGDEQTLAGSATTATITGLDDATEYRVRIDTLAADGTSLVSDTGVTKDITTSDGPSLSYPALPTVLRAGVQFETLTPTPAGFQSGSTYTYAVTDGTLPSGLKINEDTGTISGEPDTPTPTNGSSGASVTVTVTGSTGTGESKQTETATATLDFPRIFRFKLPAPTVTLEVGDTQLTANWDAVANADTYVLQWKASSVTSWTAVTGVTTVDPATPGTVITGLTNGTSYDVRVRSKAASSSTTHVDGDWSGGVQGMPAVDATFSVTGPATVVEDAGTATYTVTLSKQPAVDVTVKYTTGDGTATAGSDYTAKSDTLTFTTGSWDTAQTVDVTITNDSLDEDDETFTFTLSEPSSGSKLSSSSTVMTTITDNDTRGVTLSETTLTVDEGDSETYTVVLASQPTGNVTVTPTVPENTDISVSPASLTFTNSDWDSPQTVTMAAAEDTDTDTDPAVTITHTVAGADYASVTAGSVTVTVNDDDQSLTYPAAPTSLTVGVSVNLTATASGFGSATVAYTVTSTAQLPAGLNLNSSTGAITGMPTAASTTTTTVTVTATAGTGMDTQTATANITFPAIGKGTLATPANLALKANTQRKTSFTVSWTAVTNATGYTATATPSGGTAVTGAVTGTEATFTGLTAGTTYTVSVVATGNTANYENSTAATLSQATAANVAPSIVDITNKTATFGTNLLVDIDATDTNPGDTLQYRASSGAEAVATVSPTSLTDLGTSSQITVTPVAAGTATITVTVSDGTASPTDTFVVTVNKAVLTTPVVTISAQDGKLTATWPNVANAASYEVEYKQSTSETWLGNDDDTSPAEIDSLANGTEYDVRVRAKATSSSTTHEDSAWSEVKKGTPAAVDVVPSFGSATIAAQSWTVDTSVSLTLPAATGGNGTISYELTPALPSGVSLNASTRVVSGAPTAVASVATYTWRAKDSDSNTANTDTASLTFSVTVGKGTLATPTNLALKANTQRKTSFTVSWTAVTNATGYTATATPSGGTAVTGAVTGTEATFTGLTAGTTYTVSVVATGNTANYENSTAATLSQATAANVAPSIVDITNKTATFGTNLLVDIDATDTNPEDTLQYQASSGAEAVATVSPTSLTDLGTSSQITVTPVAAGTATITVTVSDGTASPTDTFVVTVNKAVLTTPVVTVSAQDGKLTATWPNVANAASYEVEYKQSTSETWLGNDDDTSPAEIDSLTNGTEYDVRVRAKATSSSTTHEDSAWSEVKKGTPTAVDVVPSFGSATIAAQSWTVDTSVSLTLPAATGGNGTISYELTPALPSGVSLNASTRVVSGAPRAVVSVATYTWRAKDSDSNTANTDTASLTFSVTVGKGTLATPTNLALKANTQRKTGFTVSWTAVTNATGYTATATPSGGTAVTGAVTGTEATFTGLTAGTTYTVSVVATGNTANYENSMAAMLNQATAANVAPSIVDITNKTATFGTNLLVDIDATDTNPGDTLQYRASSGAEAVATVSPTSLTDLGTSSQITVTPVAAGTATITVTVSDGTASPTDTFVVTVNKAVLTTPVVTISAQDGKLTATWPNVANAASYEVEYKQSTSETWLGNDDDTSPAEIDSLTNGTEYDVRVRAKATSSSTTHEDSAWSEVKKGTPTAVDVAPSFGSATIVAQSWTVDTSVSLTLPAATGGNGTISYELTPALPSGVSLNASTRVVSGAPTAVASAATYTWRAKDSDSNTANTDTVALAFQLTVNKAKLAKPTNLVLKANSKTRTGFTVTFDAVSNAAGYTATAVATSGTSVTVTLSTAPANPEAVFTGLEMNTTYTVTVVATGNANYANSDASDGLSVTTLTNQVPAVANEIPDQAATVGTAFEYVFPSTSFSDADSDSLTYEAKQTDGTTDSALPGWLMFIAPERKLAGTPQAANIGTLMVKVTASDSNGGSISDTFNIIVSTTTANQAPTVANMIPDQSATVDTEFSFTVPANTFSDADGDTLTYRATKADDMALPAWLTFNPDARTFSGTPTSTDTGTLMVKVTVSDGMGGLISDTFNIIVSTTTANQEVKEKLEGVNKEITPSIVNEVVGRQMASITDRFATISSGFHMGSLSMEEVVTDVADYLFSHHQDIQANGFDWRQALSGHNFSFALADTSVSQGSMDDGESSSSGSGPVSFWGGIDYSSLEDRIEPFSLDGNITSFNFGVDKEFTSDLVAGVLLSIANSKFELAEDSTDSTYEVDIFTVNPYISWEASDELSLWASVGYGWGQTDLTDDSTDDTFSQGDNFTRFSAGGRFQLWSSEAGTALALKLDGATAHFLGADMQNSRLATELSHDFSMDSAVLNTALELGLLMSSVDTSAAELIGRLHWQGDAGFSASAQSRVLLGGGDRQEWGIGGALRYTTAAGEREGEGLVVSLEPSFGISNPQLLSELWSATRLDLAVTREAPPAQLNVKLAYGFPTSDGLLTPYTDLSFSETTNTYVTGLRYGLPTGWNLNLKGMRKTSTTDAENTILLELRSDL